MFLLFGMMLLFAMINFSREVNENYFATLKLELGKR